MSQAPPYDGKLEPKISQPKDLPTLLAECDAAAEKMTPIPWRAHKPCSPVAKMNKLESVGVNGPDCLIYRMPRDYECLPETFARQEADARGIVTLRNNYPALRAEIERLTSVAAVHQREKIVLLEQREPLLRALEAAEAQLTQRTGALAVLDRWRVEASVRADDLGRLYRELRRALSEPGEPDAH